MKGTNVYLRAFEPDDYAAINKWRLDEDVYLLTIGNRYFVSSERDRQWVLEKILNNETEIYLAICLADTHALIGYLSLSEIDYRNGRAEWTGIVIGEKAYRGQGYATEAAYLLLEYAFDELRLHRISGSWLAENSTSLFLGRMMGFKQEGLLREYVYKSGRRHDVIVMSILRDEFQRFRQRYRD